jgi:hypothetical protein
MRSLSLVLSLGATLLLGCAQAVVPPPPMQAGPVPIEDVEPDVTRQVKDVLGQVANAKLARERFTERASEGLDGAAVSAMGATLRSCNAPLALELLERKTKGEDRQYLYRARCAGGDLMVEIDFNKAARINKLVVRK